MISECVESSDGCRDLDGLNIKPPEIACVGSDLAHKLIGRDFAEISVCAKEKDLVWVTVRFPAMKDEFRDDVETLRAMATNVAIEKAAWLRGECA